MFVQNVEEMEQLIAIPLDEYAELIKCQTQLNAVYGLITSQHSKSLMATGKKAICIEISLLEVVSGYEENENYFGYLKDGFMRRGMSNAN